MPSKIWRMKPKYGNEFVSDYPSKCQLCNFSTFSKESFEEHLRTSWHKYNFTVYSFEKHRKRKIKNRHGVKINVHCNNQELEYIKSDGTIRCKIASEIKDVTYQFEIVNESDHLVELLQVCLLHPFFSFKVSDEYNICNEAAKLVLHPSCSYNINVSFTNSGIGTYGVPIMFCLYPGKPSGNEFKNFDIVRVMVVDVIGPKHIEPDSSYISPFQGESWANIKETVDGKLADGRKINKLLGYVIPKHYIAIFQNWLRPWNGMSDKQRNIVFKVMDVVSKGYDVLKENYEEFFHTLLYLDEFDAVKKIHLYNMCNVDLELVTEPSRFELNVPGLAEKRPSLLKGDIVYVRVRTSAETAEEREYEGIISEVLETVVWITGFADVFRERHKREKLKYDIRFTFNRFPLYLMHRAIDFVKEDSLIPILFPSQNNLQPALFNCAVENLKFFNEDIVNNAEQQAAVINILKAETRPSPYIIFGPPGTGKTITVVEAVLQTKKRFPESRILVTAPSNSACDLLTQRLAKHCSTRELLRLHSPSREWETVPIDIHNYSNRSELLYFFPVHEDLEKYRIVVCTLISAGRLLPDRQDERSYCQPFRFSHVFIDECGQAQEPEALVPLGGVVSATQRHRIGGQVVLAGDPKQLGPMCNSLRAERIISSQRREPCADNEDSLDKKIGLGISLLERLMVTCNLYKKDKYGEFDNRYITKLRQNFRSHPTLLSLPNRLFYESDLVCNCSGDILNDPLIEKSLTNKRKEGCPLVFHGVIGHERREGMSPSHFNAFEVDQVLKYVEKLLGTKAKVKVNQSEIGIISPYIRQVYKLKKALQDLGWDKVDVGTTETFQGREKRVIIISTVRTNKNLLDFDEKYRLGFLVNPKRFNVAITRAQSLLIVVGNPYLLVYNDYWKELISMSQDLNSYEGCPYQPRDENWMKQVEQRMSHLSPDD